MYVSKAPKPKKLSTVFSLLPNVQPRKAKALIKGWNEDWFSAQFSKHKFKSEKYEPFTINVNGIELSGADYYQIIQDDGISAAVTSPVGAQLLIELYLAGVLPVKGAVTAPDEALRNYADLRYSFSDMSEIARLEREQASSELLATLNNPAGILPDEFSYTLLNNLFFHNKLIGVGDFYLEVGGVMVQKMVLRYASNSGKSQDYAVKFRWTAEDGQQHELGSDSMFAGNRRNDANRNWGLPE